MCLIDTEPIANFVEKINVKKASQISYLTNRELKEYFWDSKELQKSDREKYEWVSYLNNVKKYCKIAVKNKGEIKQTYRYGKLKYDGRLYVSGFGLQNLQSKIRNYLCCDNYIELDIKNCYPSILLYLAEGNEITTTLLKEYVTNRDEILTKYNLCKIDIIKVLNCDKNYKKQGNDWYNLFISEIETLKKELQNKIELPQTSNTKNPLSASINRKIYDIEGNIIQKLIKIIGIKNIGFPLFDAVYVDRDKEIDLSTINESFSQFKYIHFDIKDTISDITLPEKLEEAEMEYESVKIKFEESHFQTLNPPVFWKNIRLYDNSMKYVQYNTKDFQLACKEYPILITDEDGKIKKKSIFETWISDPTRRKYQSIDFIPYGIEDICPDHIYNTFEGFAINNKDVDYDMNTDITNFTEYLSNLVGEQDKYLDDPVATNCPKTSYLMKYIAHMFQYPEKLTEKIIVFKGWTGTGKDTLLKVLRNLMGYKYVDTTGDPTDLFKDFNDILESKIAIFLNEMEGSDGIKIQEKLKELATREVNKVNSKHEKKIYQSNKLRLFVLSNNDSPVSIQIHDRRYIVFNCGFGLVVKTKNEVQSKYASDFWCKFNDDLKNINWLKCVYDQLMEIDLSDFCPDKSAPVTSEYKLLKEKSFCPLYDFILEIWETKNFSSFFKKDDLYYIQFKAFKSKYIEYLENNNIVPEYKIKDSWIKQKLAVCNNSFKPSVRKRFKIGDETIRREFAEFKFQDLCDFIDNYITQETDKENEEVVELEECYCNNEIIYSDTD